MPIRPLQVRDVALAVVAVAGLVVEGAVRAKGGISPADCLLAIAAAAPLAIRTRAPLAALLAVEVGAVLCVVAFRATWAATGIVVVALYTVALLGDRRRSLAVGALTAVAVAATIALVDGFVDLPGLAPRLLLVVLALAVGDTVRSRRELRAAERDRAQRRVADERLRIARDLHDTLAHSLVAINVRAGVAVDLSGSQDPWPALRDIKHVSATALNDLRATLSLLRDEGDTAPTTPAPDLESLPRLVDQARSAGLRADVDVDLDGAGVPSAIGGAAYRIVQEALTNVLRHADASSAHVHVRVVADTLDVEITDNGRAGGTGVDAGLGLRGMDERAVALGGRIDAGPRREGGWSVHAMLPLSGGHRR